jgi:hypothetical protein
MGFKLVSKNNMGVVIILILVILLSQSRFFDFLTETSLGRLVLLMLLIFISYTNKILGLLAVLFIIIAFNKNDMNYVRSYNYYEGFDGSGNITDASGNVMDPSGNNTANTIKDKIIKDKIIIDKAKQDILNQKLDKLKQAENKSPQTSTTTSPSDSFIGGREGFCMSDRETNILRGKQSNSVPVFNNSRNQNDDVNPYDNAVFSDSYASF